MFPLQIIDPSWYFAVFQWTVFTIMLILISTCYSGRIYLRDTAKRWDLFTSFLAWGFIIIIGLRPIHRSFCDMLAYADHFMLVSHVSSMNLGTILQGSNGEFFFAWLEYVCARYGNVYLFFLVFSLMYFGTQFWACRRLFGIYWFAPFLAMVCMIDYWGFATNGIRNGAAANLMLLAMTFRHKLPIALLLGVLACGIHKSVLLIGGASILALYYRNTKAYLMAWLGCILLSLVMGQSLSDQVASSFMSDVDARLNAYSQYADNKDMMESFSSAGFRLDFLLYAAVPIAVGFWVIFRKKLSDPTYRWWLNVYLIANSFWVLMMYAAFNNRFAALSWFIAGIVLTYPFFKFKFVPHQGKVISCVLLVWYSFDFYQNIVRRILL